MAVPDVVAALREARFVSCDDQSDAAKIVYDRMATAAAQTCASHSESCSSVVTINESLAASREFEKAEVRST